MPCSFCGLWVDESKSGILPRVYTQEEVYFVRGIYSPFEGSVSNDPHTYNLVYEHRQITKIETCFINRGTLSPAMKVYMVMCVRIVAGKEFVMIETNVLLPLHFRMLVPEKRGFRLTICKGCEKANEKFIEARKKLVKRHAAEMSEQKRPAAEMSEQKVAKRPKEDDTATAA